MAKLKIVSFPMEMLSLTNLANLCDVVRILAGFPEDAQFVRQTQPWNQNVLVYWYYHPSFEDIPDYCVYKNICLKIEQFEGMIK